MTYLTFFVTSKCNARCNMCFYWREISSCLEKNELSGDEIEMIARNFGRLYYLSVTGGEPTLRDDLPDIFYYFYKHCHTRHAAFSTNGLMPQKISQIVSAILEKCPGMVLKVNVSVDGIGESHDEIRGVKGAFSKVLETIALIKELKQTYKNLHLTVGTVLSVYNKAGINKIIDYVRDNIRPDAQSLELARGNTREVSAKDVTIDEYREAIDYINNKQPQNRLMQAILDLVAEANLNTLLKRKAVLPCVAAKNIYTLTDDGLLFPCEMLGQFYPEKRGDFMIGDLRQCGYNIKTILASKKRKRILGYIKKTGCHCTFECATLWNILFNFRMYPRLILKLLYQRKSRGRVIYG